MYVRGKIKYKDINMKFIFEDDTLELIFENMEDLKEISNVKYDNKYFIQFGNEKISVSHLIGVSNDGIYEFFITSSHMSLNESFICKVGYYARYFDLDNQKYTERRLSFSSAEIDSMFCNGLLYDAVHTEEGKIGSVSLEPYLNTHPLNHYFSVDGVNYNIRFDNGFTYYSDTLTPIVFKNSINLEFDKYKSLDDLYACYVGIRTLLSFMYHRRNIYFSNIIIYGKENDKFTKIGEFVVLERNTHTEEINMKKCIKYNEISSVFTLLSKKIFSNDIHTHHLPLSSKSNRVVTAGDFIVLLAAFEHEFDNNYEVIHCNQSIKARQEVHETIDSLIASSKGKVKEKYKNFKKHIDDDILSGKIIHLFKIMPLEMERLGKGIYTRNGFKFNSDSISKRIEKQRNNFAHGNIKEEFVKESLADFLFLEKIVYFIQLVDLGLDKQSALDLSNRVTIG